MSCFKICPNNYQEGNSLINNYQFENLLYQLHFSALSRFESLYDFI